ncbi:MAG: response regulator [Acidobacteria bacterium]|nr:response regulator [Acidobacteriota bacterium]
MTRAPKTILCVDDEELELEARKKFFESAGFRVLQAQSKDSALDLFRSSYVDAVGLDYWLSGTSGNGRALAEEIKLISPAPPVVMLSGYGSLPGEGTIVDSWMGKANCEPQHLLSEVNRLIELRKHRQTEHLG